MRTLRSLIAALAIAAGSLYTAQVAEAQAFQLFPAYPYHGAPGYYYYYGDYYGPNVGYFNAGGWNTGYNFMHGAWHEPYTPNLQRYPR